MKLVGRRGMQSAKAALSPAALDLTATVLLATAALATSWVTYQAVRWGGVQAAKFSEASIVATRAATQVTIAAQQRAIDVGLFTAWLTAADQRQARLEEFIQARFRPEFQPAFRAWLAKDPGHDEQAPTSPFVMPEYHSQAADSASVLTRGSLAAFQTAAAANQQSDLYTLTAVILASVLFFAGISQQARLPYSRLTLLIFGAIGCAIGIRNIIVFPIH